MADGHDEPPLWSLLLSMLELGAWRVDASARHVLQACAALPAVRVRACFRKTSCVMEVSRVLIRATAHIKPCIGQAHRVQQRARAVRGGWRPHTQTCIRDVITWTWEWAPRSLSRTVDRRHTYYYELTILNCVCDRRYTITMHLCKDQSAIHINYNVQRH